MNRWELKKTLYTSIIIMLITFLTVYIFYRLKVSEATLIPISVLALIGGTIFEFKRLVEKWSEVFRVTLLSFCLSYVAFLPGKREAFYSFDEHIERWPYYFMAFFIMVAIAFHGKKIVPKLTEGITLLQSMAAMYWIVDYGFFGTNNVLVEAAMAIVGVFSLYSLFHALTDTALTPSRRFTLSVWSSIVMFFFAINNIYSVYTNGQIENTANITHGFYIGLQYFLLGISSIYIVQNFFMLAGFLPGRGTFFNKQYFEDLHELKRDHIQRYADSQVNIGYSLFCVVFAGAIFSANFYYQFLPRHIMIWIVFVTFPLFIRLYELSKSE